jgi:hypothetical protein
MRILYSATRSIHGRALPAGARNADSSVMPERSYAETLGPNHLCAISAANTRSGVNGAFFIRMPQAS